MGLPVPLLKSADSSQAFQLDVAFLEDGLLEVSGSLRDDLTWAMRLESLDQRWQIERGAIHAGSAAALLPGEPGVELSGHLDMLRFDDWLDLDEGEGDSGWQELYRQAVLDIDRFSLFGQIFSERRSRSPTWRNGLGNCAKQFQYCRRGQRASGFVR